MNIKKDILSSIEDMNEPLVCAELKIYPLSESEKNIPTSKMKPIIAFLKEDYTKEEYEEFLNKIDVECDVNGYVQYLYGAMWFSEDSFERWGSGYEFWIPSEERLEIPQYLKK